MGKIIRLSESDLNKIVKRVIKEGKDYQPCEPSELKIIMRLMRTGNDFKIEDINDTQLLLVSLPGTYDTPCKAKRADVFK